MVPNVLASSPAPIELSRDINLNLIADFEETLQNGTFRFVDILYIVCNLIILRCDYVENKQTYAVSYVL